MSNETHFENWFKELTGNSPFPWQRNLIRRFIAGRTPRCCDIPTGIGKTSVIPIWLIALAEQPETIPRRLVYVVNRRTVVDQTTDEVTRLREQLSTNPQLAELRDRIGSLAISTLRGQFADNHEWSADPARPSVIVGTVDMIGSRLLFGGYRIGFKSRPLHAGFLGQDALLVHDEAHLEPGFQELVEAIEREQSRETEIGGNQNCWPPLCVMALSATARADIVSSDGSNQKDVLKLGHGDRTHPIVKQRIEAVKRLTLVEIEDEKKELANTIVEWAKNLAVPDSAVLIFVRKVDDVLAVARKLPDDATESLTGTLRGWERDGLVRSPVFQRFLPESNRDGDIQPAEGPVFLVCTSAGEVGVNISADHLVCDLTTFDSMVQRLGRVNRFGDREAQIYVVVDATRNKAGAGSKASPLQKAIGATDTILRQWIKRCNGQANANPLNLRSASAGRKRAFTPEPKILPVTDILFDAWSLTTIRKKLPGRPPLEPFLHGMAEWEPPETYVAWREEVERITGNLLAIYKPEDLLEQYPLKPHELLREPSSRVFKHLQTLAKRHPREPAWLVDDHGHVTPLTLEELTDKNSKDQINYRTVLLPPSVGGLKNGMLNGSSETANDVADEWYADREQTIRRRKRVWQGEPVPDSMRLLLAIDTDPDAEEGIDEEAEAASRRLWLWYTLPQAADDDLSRSAAVPIPLQDHADDVVGNVKRMVRALNLPDGLARPLIVAAKLHDLGKRRALWQRSIGNPNPSEPFAKSGRNPTTGIRWRPVEITGYRHEFGSLLDIRHSDDAAYDEFRQLDNDAKELVLHLIATHHGRGRPHFPTDEQFDPEYPQDKSDAVAIEIPVRFARLQRKYGRWGLAYIESLLRAADWAASANPTRRSEEAS